MTTPVIQKKHSIRAPEQHGRSVIVPAWHDAEALLQENLLARGDWSYDLQGLPADEWMRQAQAELRTAAVAYTSQYRDGIPETPPGKPIILSGHQPQLFHAGVWFKNFALAALGQQADAVAINVLIDNDILRVPAIRVPTLQNGAASVTSVPLDRPLDPIPYEERGVVDRSMFESFDQRVCQATRGLLADPVLHTLWPHVLAAYDRTKNIGLSTAEARHRVEGEWGQETLEVPLSDLCDTPSFAWFTAHLLAHLPRFQDIHNASLWHYRRDNRLRSRAHPVPDLAEGDGWLEAPILIWSASVPHRQHLFVRSSGDRLLLSDRQGLVVELPLTPDGEAARAVARMVELESEGIRLRPRALTTTMYLRLAMGDLFLHGIGGAKYDQLTDRIIEHFFGLAPPKYLTCSATLKLFPDNTHDLKSELRRTQRLLREFRFHPEWHAAATAENLCWIQQKRDWLGRDLPRGHRRARHQGIREANQRLEATLADRREVAVAEQRRLGVELRRQQQLTSREFSFCLFSEEELRETLPALVG